MIDISNFAYASGDMSIATSVPTIKQGQSITFDNLDAPLGNGIWHTITDCARAVRRQHRYRVPARQRARSSSTPVSSASAARRRPGSVTWSTPTNLPPGTYTYFCRIHPFMRGAFRVVAN